MLTISSAVDRVFERSQARVVQAREREHQHAARRPGRSPGGRRSSAAAPATGSAWPRRASRSSRSPSPITASVSSGSSGRRSVRAPGAGSCARGARSGGCDRAQRAQSVFELPATNFLRLAEPLRGDQARDRRGRFGAEAALLDGHRDHDRALRVADVAHVPGLVFLADVFGGAGLAVHRVLAPGSSRPTHRPRCRRARLAASWMPSITRLRSASLRCTWRAGGKLSACTRPPLRFVDLHAEVRASRRCRCRRSVGVGERRVGDRHLQRVGQQIALADRQVHVVADAPRPHFGDDSRTRRGGVRCSHAQLERVLVLRATRASGSRRRTRSAGRCPVGSPTPSSCAIVLDHVAVAVGELADFEEVGVRGDLQRFHERRRRRSRLCPALQNCSVETEMHWPAAEALRRA